MPKEIYIGAYHGGLGDNLQLSTLPELFFKKGLEVHVPAGFYFRNSEIYDLVWGCNPYVSGIKEGVWNAGDTPEIGHRILHPSCISNWEMLHGFEPKNLYPKIYYIPKKNIEMNDVFLMDMSSISTSYNKLHVEKVLEGLKLQHPNKRFFNVEFVQNLNPRSFNSPAHNGVFNKISQKNKNIIKVLTIFEYCDIMSSVGGIVTLHSGASHLSSAMKEYNPSLISKCIIQKDQYYMHKNRSVFIFDNIEYILI